MEVRVKAWMSGDPVALGPEASALEALELLAERGIHHLPVVDAERRVVGIVSVEDLRAALPLPVSLGRLLSGEERRIAREWSIGEIMTHAPETVTSETPLAEAAECMADRHIGCLPVVDPEGKLAGMLSESDALRALATMLLSVRARERRGRELELEALVDQLRGERDVLAARLDRLHAVEQELSAEPREQPMDEAESAADLREVRLAEVIDALTIRRLEAIDRALDKAAQGRLGVCDRCGGTIALNRLRALPGTTVCVSCARSDEAAAGG